MWNLFLEHFKNITRSISLASPMDPLIKLQFDLSEDGPPTAASSNLDAFTDTEAPEIPLFKPGMLIAASRSAQQTYQSVDQAGLFLEKVQSTSLVAIIGAFKFADDINGISNSWAAMVHTSFTFTKLPKAQVGQSDAQGNAYTAADYQIGLGQGNGTELEGGYFGNVRPKFMLYHMFLNYRTRKQWAVMQNKQYTSEKINRARPSQSKSGLVWDPVAVGRYPWMNPTFSTFKAVPEIMRGDFEDAFGLWSTNMNPTQEFEDDEGIVQIWNAGPENKNYKLVAPIVPVKSSFQQHGWVSASQFSKSMNKQGSWGEDFWEVDAEVDSQAGQGWSLGATHIGDIEFSQVTSEAVLEMWRVYFCSWMAAHMATTINSGLHAEAAPGEDGSHALTFGKEYFSVNADYLAVKQNSDIQFGNPGEEGPPVFGVAMPLADGYLGGRGTQDVYERFLKDLSFLWVGLGFWDVEDAPYGMEDYPGIMSLSQSQFSQFTTPTSDAYMPGTVQAVSNPLYQKNMFGENSSIPAWVATYSRLKAWFMDQTDVSSQNTSVFKEMYDLLSKIEKFAAADAMGGEGGDYALFNNPKNAYVMPIPDNPATGAALFG